jgi:hypothetical protein
VEGEGFGGFADEAGEVLLQEFWLGLHFEICQYLAELLDLDLAWAVLYA